MATSKNTSTSSSTVTEARTFNNGIFKVSDGADLREKLEQASLFLDAAYEVVDEGVSGGETNIKTLWGCARMLEAAKALIDSANEEVPKAIRKGGAA